MAEQAYNSCRHLNKILWSSVSYPYISVCSVLREIWNVSSTVPQKILQWLAYQIIFWRSKIVIYGTILQWSLSDNILAFSNCYIWYHFAEIPYQTIFWPSKIAIYGTTLLWSLSDNILALRNCYIRYHFAMTPIRYFLYFFMAQSTH